MTAEASLKRSMGITLAPFLIQIDKIAAMVWLPLCRNING